MLTDPRLLELLAALFGILMVFAAHRRAKRRYVRLPYEAHSRPASDAWRWRAPDDSEALLRRSDEDPHGLRVEDSPHASALRLPLRMLTFEKGGVLFGYAGLLLCAWMLIVMLIHDRPPLLYLVVAIFAGLSWLLLSLGSRVTSIELREDRLIFTLNYGIWFSRTRVFRHNPSLKFEGRCESMFEMTVDHDLPDFKLYIVKKGFILSKKWRFFMSVNQSQGEWLVEGLRAWSARDKK
ncbi:hypothetical protein KKF91_07145 [Myxococcota bacterium]|nr:hypothetical protein [Myxococcota bacterium]MBU1430328.1 hypothetical protein [Myxococcota bacterium]MBU1900610.1 hypothetical protein [Myxococcota bacterium]